MDTADAYKKILEKKISEHDSRYANNFSSPGELTVTITLNEYRYLVTEKAKSDSVEQERRTKWSKEYKYKRANDLQTENDMFTNMKLSDTNDKEKEE